MTATAIPLERLRVMILLTSASMAAALGATGLAVAMGKQKLASTALKAKRAVRFALRVKLGPEPRCVLREIISRLNVRAWAAKKFPQIFTRPHHGSRKNPLSEIDGWDMAQIASPEPAKIPSLETIHLFGRTMAA